MAATNPFRVSDLIAKYGWQIMPYLSNLGVRSLAEAQVLFVDSGHTNALDADDGEHGHSLTKPLATWDYAVGLLTADEGGIILLAPGHNENIADGETIDNDINGVVCIGLGTGTLRPRLDYDAAASTIYVGANNVTFVNLTFMPGAGDVLIGVDVETGKTNFRMVDCEFLAGEESGDEFLAAVELKAACHDAVIENNVFRAGWSSNPDDGVSLKGASNNVTIRNNRFSGPYGDGAGVTAAISNSTGVCLDLLIENNILKVKDNESGIEVIATTPAVIRRNLIISTGLAVDSMIVGIIAELDQNVGITTDGTSGEFIKGGAISPEVVNYNLDHLMKTVVGDKQNMAEIVNNTVLSHILTKTDGDIDDFDPTLHSLEAIADAVDGIAVPTDVTGAVGATPTGSSLQDILQKDANETYDNTKHSLEKIAENLSAAIGSVTAGSVMDILKKLYYTADGGSTAYPTTIANDSALAKIMVKGTPANIDQFDNTSHSLEAIADAVTALGITGAVSTTPTARSLQDILEKDTGGHFNDATDSLEAIADRLIDSQVDVFTGAVDGGTHAYPDSVVTKSVLAYLMTSDGDITGYNYADDSLEAISDALAAGTGCTAAIEADGLDHLCQLDGTAAYPQTVATDSIIAKICSIGGAADPATYDNAEDSLQAISEFVRTGTTLGAGIGLDHLLLTTDVVADDDLTTFAADKSLLSHIMTTGADTSVYDASLHSLQAIAEALTAGTGVQTVLVTNNLDNLLKTSTAVDADGDLSGHVITKSVLGHIMSADADVTTGYNCSTDSLAAIAASILTGATILSGINLDHLAKVICADTVDAVDMSTEIANDTILANILDDGGVVVNYDRRNHSLVALGTDTDAILADTAAIDPGATRVHTRTLTTWTATANALWDVSAPVKAKIWGVVLGVIKNVAMNLKIGSTPTAPGGLVDITANLDCDADAVGTVYKLNTTLGGAMVEVTGGVTLDNGIEVILPAGKVTMTSAAIEDGTGSIQWIIEYEPLVAGAVVTDT